MAFYCNETACCLVPCSPPPPKPPTCVPVYYCAVPISPMPSNQHGDHHNYGHSHADHHHGNHHQYGHSHADHHGGQLPVGHTHADHHGGHLPIGHTHADHHGGQLPIGHTHADHHIGQLPIGHTHADHHRSQLPIGHTHADHHKDNHGSCGGSHAKPCSVVVSPVLPVARDANSCCVQPLPGKGAVCPPPSICEPPKHCYHKYPLEPTPVCYMPCTAQPSCQPPKPKTATKYIMPCYRYDDGRIERYTSSVHGRLPITVFKRNGLQDQLYKDTGINYLLTGPCGDIYKHVKPLKPVFTKISQEISPILKKIEPDNCRST